MVRKPVVPMGLGDPAPSVASRNSKEVEGRAAPVAGPASGRRSVDRSQVPCRKEVGKGRGASGAAVQPEVADGNVGVTSEKGLRWPVCCDEGKLIEDRSVVGGGQVQ